MEQQKENKQPPRGAMAAMALHMERHEAMLQALAFNVLKLSSTIQESLPTVPVSTESVYDHLTSVETSSIDRILLALDIYGKNTVTSLAIADDYFNVAEFDVSKKYGFTTTEAGDLTIIKSGTGLSFGEFLAKEYEVYIDKVGCTEMNIVSPTNTSDLYIQTTSTIGLGSSVTLMSLITNLNQSIVLKFMFDRLAIPALDKFEDEAIAWMEKDKNYIKLTDAVKLVITNNGIEYYSVNDPLHKHDLNNIHHWVLIKQALLQYLADKVNGVTTDAENAE